MAPIPDSAIVAQHAEVLDMWARHGKPTATWGELPWRNIPLELPEGVTRNDVVQEVFDRLTAKGTVKISADGDTFTYAPAADAVAAVCAVHVEMSSHVTNAMASGVFRGALGGITPPTGWDISTLHQLAMDALVADGTLVIEDGLYRNTKAKAPEPKPVVAPELAARNVEPVKPVPEPTPTPTKPEPTKPAPVAKAAPARDTALLVSIDQGVRNLGQVLAMPQAAAREALAGANRLHVVLLRVMAVTQAKGPMNRRALSAGAFSKPEDRALLTAALDYGTTTGALTRTGVVHGAMYATADPTRIGVTWAELNAAAAKVKTRAPRAVTAGK